MPQSWKVRRHLLRYLSLMEKISVCLFRVLESCLEQIGNILQYSPPLAIFHRRANPPSYIGFNDAAVPPNLNDLGEVDAPSVFLVG